MDGSLQSVSQTETSGGMVQLVLPPALVSVFSVTLGDACLGALCRLRDAHRRKAAGAKPSIIGLPEKQYQSFFAAGTAGPDSGNLFPEP